MTEGVGDSWLLLYVPSWACWACLAHVCTEWMNENASCHCYAGVIWLCNTEHRGAAGGRPGPAGFARLLDTSLSRPAWYGEGLNHPALFPRQCPSSRLLQGKLRCHKWSVDTLHRGHVAVCSSQFSLQGSPMKAFVMRLLAMSFFSAACYVSSSICKAILCLQAVKQLLPLRHCPDDGHRCLVDMLSMTSWSVHAESW